MTTSQAEVKPVSLEDISIEQKAAVGEKLLQFLQTRRDIRGDADGAHHFEEQYDLRHLSERLKTDIGHDAAVAAAALFEQERVLANELLSLADGVLKSA